MHPFAETEDLAERYREALRDPALALNRALMAFPNRFRKVEDDLGKARKADPKRSSKAKLGLWDSLVSGAMKGKIEELEQSLVRLQEKYDELKDPLFPASKEWTFSEIDDEVSSLYRRVTQAWAHVQQLESGSEGVKQSTEIAGQRGLENFLRVVHTVSQTLNATYDLNDTLLTACKLHTELQDLFLKRRLLMPGFLAEVAGWDKHRIGVEIQRRARDLKDLERISSISKYSACLPPHQAIYQDQRCFLEDLGFELNAAAAKRGEVQCAPRDRAAEKISRIAELNRKMDEALKSNPVELEADIKRVYGQLMDEERKKI